MSSSPPPLANPRRHGIHTSRPIVLTGYMGAGKSTIGRQLAKALGLPFYDTDREVVKQAQMTIPKVFDQFGEAHFRALERQALSDCLTRGLCVLATGGGTLTQEANLNLAKEKAWVVYLQAPADYLFERVIFSPKERPMLDVPNAEQAFLERFKQREPYYLQAHGCISTPGKRPAQVVELLLNWLYQQEGTDDHPHA